MNKHSFGVLAYKDSPYLSECIESLKNQTHASDIFISTSTPSEYISNIAKKYDVELFVNQTDLRGGVHDDNFCLQQVKTKYFTFAHQDDIYLPEYAETCLAASEKVADTLICFTNYSEIMDGIDRPITPLLRVKRFMLWVYMPFKSHCKSKFLKRNLLSFGNPIALPTVFHNLEMLPGFHYPLESAHKINTIDWEAWYDMARMKGTFVYVKSVQLKRRIHGDSLSTAGIEDNSRYKEDLAMFKRFWWSGIAKILAKIYAIGYKSNK